jgi:hypothetical protein
MWWMGTSLTLALMQKQVKQGAKPKSFQGPG